MSQALESVMAPFSCHFVITFFSIFPLGTYGYFFLLAWIVHLSLRGLSLLLLFCPVVFCTFAISFHLFQV